jgi:hypothetical protein
MESKEAKVNMLIIGGIVIVALAALVGVVLLNIGEERADKEQKAKENAAAALPQQSSLPQQPPAPPAVVEHSTDEQGDKAATGKLVPLNKEVSLNDLNGQLYEITDALLLLAQRVGELDLRMNDLTTTLERREREHEASGVTEVTEITDHQLHVPDFNARARS